MAIDASVVGRKPLEKAKENIAQRQERIAGSDNQAKISSDIIQAIDTAEEDARAISV